MEKGMATSIFTENSMDRGASVERQSMESYEESDTTDRLTHTFLKMGLKICCVTLLAVGEELIKYDSWAFKHLFVNRLVLSFPLTEFYFLTVSRRK